MTRRALIALGIGQCVNWGALYYAFAILVLPLERELAVPTWIVTGAFSLALLMSAAAAPLVGRWADRDHGARLIQGGAMIAALLLVAWAAVPGVLMLYLVWAALGLCMAAALYEPAFVLVGRAYDHPVQRMRALATVTLFGGLASTIFLPATALLVGAMEWRGAVLVLAALLAVSAAITHTFAFGRGPAPHPAFVAESSTRETSDSGPESRRFELIAACFALGSLASAGLAANLVPALGERGASPATAAMLGGLMGAMQLPGRVWLMSGAFAGAPARLLAASLLLHAVGLAAVAVARSPLAIAAGLIAFALGAGATTLVRPHLVLMMFGGARAGALNGRLARRQQLARAAGPLAFASLAGVASYGAVLGALALTFAGLTLAAAGVLGDSRQTVADRRST